MSRVEDVDGLAPEILLEVSNLTASRAGRIIWRHLEIKLSPGTLLHVTGANGSGKTTLLNVLAGIADADEGEIKWCGLSARRSTMFRHHLAYLTHNNGLNADMSVADNLEYTARLAGNTATADLSAATREALAAVGLPRLSGRLLRELSQGQQRRVALARLLLQRARLWLLDEPFNALDDESISRFSSILSAHLMQGGLAIISTHQPVNIAAPSVRTLQL